jgi:hypothetical protein
MKSLRFYCLAAVVLVVSVAAQTTPRQVTTILAGGTVVTVDGAGSCNSRWGGQYL